MGRLDSIQGYTEDRQKYVVLRHLDTDAGKGDVLEGDLDAVLPEAPSPTEAEWA